MKQFSVALMCVAAVFAGTGALAQNTYQLFGPVDTRATSISANNPYGTSTLNLSCPASPSAVVSSTTDGTGNVFTDNFIGLSVNGAAQFNICQGGDPNEGQEGGTNCFLQTYETAAPGLVGSDPDTTIVATYGIPALNISADFPAGSVQAQFQLIDIAPGGFDGASTLYLDTNCSLASIAPGGSLTGNPVTTTTPTQQFNFDGAMGQRVEFTADYSAAVANGDVTIISGTTPVVNDNGIEPSAWPAIVAGTSFATTSCVPSIGEVDSSNNPLCKASTILCTNSQSSTPLGDNCPQSTSKDVVMQYTFDPSTTGATLVTTGLPSGTGIGFLMGSDSWPGSACSFIGPETGAMCPQNPLTSFDGDMRSGSGGDTTNSTFIVVAGVPLATTAASFTPDSSGWSDSTSVNLSFTTTPPTVAPPNNGFVAAPIQTLTYGIDDVTLTAGTNYTALPIQGDVTLPKTNPITCPSAPTPGTGPLTETDSVTLAEGSHTLHYFSTDCAGTEELVFTPNISNPNSWVSFKTLTINVDTTNPKVVSGPTLSPMPPYIRNQTGVVATYSCVDPAGSGGAAASGLAVCGPTNAVTTSSPVNTSALGAQSFTVNVKDVAGNVGTPASVPYTVNDYNFTGFFLVANPPVLNKAIAGLPVPVTFGLGGNQGTNIFAPGYPGYVHIACSGTATSTAPDTPSTNFGLIYIPLTKTYTYLWNVPKSLAGTCQQFQVKLIDGTMHVANFKF